MNDVVLGLFEHTEAGARALKAVLEAGVSPGAIVVVGDLGIPAGEAGAMHHVTLDALGVPRAEREVFMDGIRSGGVVLAVRGDVDAMGVMRECGALRVERVGGGGVVGSHNLA